MSSFLCSAAVGCVRLFAAPQTVTHLAPLSVDSPGKDTGVGFRVLLQGIFPTQGSNPSLVSPALAGGFLPLSHLELWHLAFVF